MAVQTGDTGSFPTLQVVINRSAGANQYYISSNENIISSYRPAVDPLKQFNIFPKLKSKSGAPSTGDIPERYFGVFENTDTVDLKLWCN